MDVCESFHSSISIVIKLILLFCEELSFWAVWWSLTLDSSSKHDEDNVSHLKRYQNLLIKNHKMKQRGKINLFMIFCTSRMNFFCLPSNHHHRAAAAENHSTLSWLGIKDRIINFSGCSWCREKGEKWEKVILRLSIMSKRKWKIPFGFNIIKIQRKMEENFCSCLGRLWEWKKTWDLMWRKFFISNFIFWLPSFDFPDKYSMSCRNRRCEYEILLLSLGAQRDNILRWAKFMSKTCCIFVLNPFETQKWRNISWDDFKLTWLQSQSFSHFSQHASVVLFAKNIFATFSVVLSLIQIYGGKCATRSLIRLPATKSMCIVNPEMCCEKFCEKLRVGGPKKTKNIHENY